MTTTTAAALAAVVIVAGCANSGSGAGPRVPACGIAEITQAESIAGQPFPAGEYLVHAFGIACDEVLGAGGLLAQFLELADDEPLPEPWAYLEGAVGAPKFAAGPSMGFRLQRVVD